MASSSNPSVPDEMDQLVKRKKYRRNTLGFWSKEWRKYESKYFRFRIKRVGWANSQPGSDDLPERREQQRAQVCPPTIACPCPRPCVQFDVRSTHHLCGGCAQAGCNSEAPTAPSSAPPPLPLQWLRRMFVSQLSRNVDVVVCGSRDPARRAL
jgi:hypothetical protein